MGGRNGRAGSRAGGAGRAGGRDGGWRACRQGRPPEPAGRPAGRLAGSFLPGPGGGRCSPGVAGWPMFPHPGLGSTAYRWRYAPCALLPRAAPGREAGETLLSTTGLLGRPGPCATYGDPEHPITEGEHATPRHTHTHTTRNPHTHTHRHAHARSHAAARPTRLEPKWLRTRPPTATMAERALAPTQGPSWPRCHPGAASKLPALTPAEGSKKVAGRC